MALFTNAKWIWQNSEAKNDEYVDFYASFNVDTDKKYTLKIASDSNYALYINGRFAEFGQYADYPEYKIADVIDITKYLRQGENKLCFTVWYYGTDTQTYIHGEAGFIYEVDADGEIISFSSENTLSRPSRGYISYEQKLISGQLGFTYHFDAKKYDGFWENGVKFDFKLSREVKNISYNISERPIKKLTLKDRLSAKICMQGYFEYKLPTDAVEQNMQTAALSYRNFGSLHSILPGDGVKLGDETKRNANSGIYFIVDLGEETSGFLDIDIELPCDCRIDIGYGEHLEDGRCRTGIRNFTAVYEGVKGRNKFLNQFRRFGCRYVELFIHAESAVVYYAGIRPTVYPITAKKYKSGNLLRNTIYSVCENTLLHSMHEHYEDCPWREQALYCMDSRNQMLCGYYAFKEYEFPRAALKLMSYGVLPNGLLSICYPCGIDLLIPSFSAVYFIQMYEYIKYSGDTSLAEESYGLLCDMMNVFLRQKTDSGVLVSFTGKGYWNFYEWSHGLAGRLGNEPEAVHEAMLNAYVSLALENMANISESLGKKDDANYYRKERDGINDALTKAFYNKDVGLFENCLERRTGEYSVLTNAMCLLCGAANNIDKTKILEILASNGKVDIGVPVIPNTLSMNSFRFDALIREDKEKYSRVILDEIDADYLYMLRKGATSFWETIDGAEAFGDAGSLCHGWSALPVYYYETLL